MQPTADALACVYCGAALAADADIERISHRVFAHSLCAWTVDERLWAKLDMEEVSGSDKNRADERPT